MSATTGDQFTHFTNKKILGFDDLGVNYLDYLKDHNAALATNIFQQDGTFGGTKLGLAGNGNDKFQVTDITEQTDGAGNLVELPVGAGFSTGIQFENTNAIDYYVGLHHAERPRGIRINPRLGKPEFEFFEETVGERAEPDAVTVGGSTITFELDSVAEAGVSNAGRKALVWKKTPGEYATVEGQAVEELTVFYSGGKNQITTTTLLGQAVGSGDTADYYVLLFGPSVRRNTDLRPTTEYAFLGTVTGAGAGNPPTVFDVSDQWLIPYFSDLSDIVRTHTNGHLKIQVKSYAGESDVAQVEVLAPGGSTVFRVNEAGDVVIVGDLDVTGTTTTHDEVTVESHATITDNLTAGDDDASDSHTIKGGWKHTDNAGTANYFTVDGPSGRVGVGQIPDGTAQFAATGLSKFTGSIIPGADNSYDLGSMAARWANAYVVNIIFSGDFLPLTDNAQDIGSLSKRWAEMWSVANYIGDANFCSTLAGGTDPTIQFDTSDFIDFDRSTNTMAVTIAASPILDASPSGVAISNAASDYTPFVDSTYVLGSSTFKWSQAWVAAYYIDTNFSLTLSGSDPQILFDVGDNITYDRSANDLVFNIGGSPIATIDPAGMNIAGITVINTLDINGRIDGDLLPQTDDNRDLGSATYQWDNIYANGIIYCKYLSVDNGVGEGVLADFVPANSAVPSLGNGSRVWKRLYLSATAGDGCVLDFNPVSDNTLNLGSTVRRWYSVFCSAQIRSGTSTTAVRILNQAGNFLQGLAPETAKQTLYIDSLYTAGGTPSGEQSIVFRTGSTASPVQRMQINEDGKIQTGSSSLATDVTTQGGFCVFASSAGTAQSWKYTGVNTTLNSPHQDTYGRLQYYNNSLGGLRLDGYANGTIAMLLAATGTTYSTTTSVSAYGACTVDTSVTSMPATGNAFVVRNTQQGGAAFIVKADGDLFVNSSVNTTGGAGYVNGPATNAVRYFDDEKDAVACQDLAYAMAGAWDKVMAYQRPELERLGVMKNGFLSYKRATALQLGAIGELHLVVSHLCKKFGLDYEELRKELRGLATT